MADKHKSDPLTRDEQQTVKLLEDYVPKDAMSQMPKETQGFIKTGLGMVSRVINGYIGGAAGNLAIRYASWKNYTPETQAKYGVWGERVARGAMTTLPTRIKPAYNIIKDFFHGNSAVKNGFARALQAEGGSSSIFGLNSNLEVIRHQRDVNSKSTIYRTQGLLMGLFNAVPGLMLNEAEMMIDNVKRHYDAENIQQKIDNYQNIINPEKGKGRSLSVLEERDLNRAKADLKKVKDEAEKAGGVLAKQRSNQASKIINWMDGQSWIPGEAGSSGGGLIEMLAEQDPTFKGDFKKDGGQGRVDFLNYIKVRAGLLYESFVPNFLNKIIGDRFTPKAKELLAKPSAGQMILGLEGFLKENPTPVRVSLGKKNTTLEEYIFEIFAQHREDMGRPKLTLSQADEVREACVAIADAMTDPNRKLHPQALVFLVDSKYGIMREGKVLKDDTLSNTIQSLIDVKGLTSRVRPGKGESAYAQSGFTKEEVFESWANLTEDEKTVWSTFFSNEMLLEGGVDRDELKRLRRRGNELCFEVMTEMFKELENVSQQDLKEAGLDSKLIRQLYKFKDNLDSNKRDAQNYLQEHRQEAMSLTAELGVKLDNDRPGFLSEIIEKAQNRRDGIEEPEPKAGRASFRERVREGRGDDEEMPGPSRHQDKVESRRHHKPDHYKAEHSEVEAGHVR